MADKTNDAIHEQICDECRLNGGGIMDIIIDYNLSNRLSQIVFSELKTNIKATLKNAEEITKVTNGDVYMKESNGTIKDVLDYRDWKTYTMITDLIQEIIVEKVKNEKKKEIEIDAQEIVERYKKIKEEEEAEKREKERIKQEEEMAKQKIEKVREMLNVAKNYLDFDGYDAEEKQVYIWYAGGRRTAVDINKSVEEIATIMREKMREAELERLKGVENKYEELKKDYERLKEIVQKLVDVEQLQEEIEEQEEKEQEELTKDDKKFLIQILDP